MTDAEWAALALYVTHRRGRPPRDPRRMWDGIFWIACSDLPWAALPRELGHYRTAHSTLVDAGRTGVLDRLLIAVSDHVFAEDALVSLRWRVQRAVRRASRQLGAATLYLARDLGLKAAIYCTPEALPDLAPPDAPPRAAPPALHPPPRAARPGPAPRRVPSAKGRAGGTPPGTAAGEPEGGEGEGEAGMG